ncbi:hypothetical protein ACTA71_002571 [Dictyostelium dimigraforme]
MKFIYKLTDCLIGHSREVTSISISSEVSNTDFKYIVSGSKDGTVIIWKSKERNNPATLYKVIKGHSDVVQKVAISADQKYVFSCSWDCNVCIWEVESGQCIKTIKHESQVMDLSYQRAWEDDYISTIQSNGKMMIWHSKKAEPLFFINNQFTHCLLGNRPTLCTSTSDNMIFTLGNFTNEEYSIQNEYNHLKSFPFQHKGGIINEITHSPDFSILASGCSEGELYLWNFQDVDVEHLLHLNAGSSINNITFNFNPNSPIQWCSTANDINIIIWSFYSKKPQIIANIIIDDLSDINNENKDEIISKFNDKWRDSDYYKTQLKLRKDQGIQDKPFIRSLSICWLNDQVFYVACDDGTIREYTIKEEENTL